MTFKSNLLLAVLTLLLSALELSVSAQAPGKIPYQGVARDAQGNALQNQNISLILSIEDASGTVLFSETHYPTTNQFGLFNVQIGSSVALPSNLWGNGDRFLHVKMDPQGGSSYTDLGTTQFLSVPYALYAESSNTPGPQGPAGPQGANGRGIAGVAIENNHLMISYTDGTVDNVGSIGVADSTIENRVAWLEENTFVPPTLSTPIVDNITSSGARFHFDLLDMGSTARILIKGFVVSFQTIFPTVENSPSYIMTNIGGAVCFPCFPIDGYSTNDVGPFEFEAVEYFSPSLSCYVRAFVQDDYGNNYYSDPVNFITLPSPEILGQSAGGVIYYDKGFYSDGWRYLEYNYDAAVQRTWGCSDIVVGSSNTDLGFGDLNIPTFNANCTELSSASVYCENLTFGGYSDWYLPNPYEMGYILSGMHIPGNRLYWTSVDDPSNPSLAMASSGNNNFNAVPLPKDNSYYVVPVRKF